jgi:hypothetical protein
MGKRFQATAFPDVFVSSREMSKAVSAAVADGIVRKIMGRLYTSNVVDEPELIVRRNLWRVVSLLVPGAVISHRTAIEMKPADDNSVFLTAGYNRRVELPGLTLRMLEGPGALEGDTQLFDLHLASRARALLEVLRPSRAREGVARGLPRAKVEEVLEREMVAGGEPRLNEIRDQARVLAPHLEADDEFELLSGIIGALLGTRQKVLTAPAAIARAAGEPYDAGRLERFQTLLAALRTMPVASRPDERQSGAEFSNVSFFDAYFSNFIEGTRFNVGEAHEIVFDGKIPRSRPEDAHDVLGTYRLVGSRAFMTRNVLGFANFDAFVEALRVAHAEILSARPDKRPGQFKDVTNIAGETTFVAPDLVRGTLRQGFEIARSLDAPFQRSVAMMFMLSEIHPFDDGNGRIARAFMNAELIGGGQTRILIPIVYRDDYLTGLRVLTRQGRPEPLIQVLDFAHRYTAAIDFSDYDSALAALRATNALEDPRPDVRLVMPRNAPQP